MEERKFNAEPSFTKTEDGFIVEKDTHAKSEIKPIEQMQLMAQQMNQIKWFIDQCKNSQAQVLKIVEWYNIRVDIMNNAKKELWLKFTEMEKIDAEVLKNLIDADPEKLPKIDLSWLEAKKEEKK